MIKVTLPDGSVKEMAQGVTPMDVAKSISEGLARNVISASYNGTTIETTTTLTTDGTLILYTWNDKEGKKAFWHSTSHVMAQALEELFPGIKLTLGPAIDNGFYYDVDFGDKKITDADFKKIEDRVLEISREKHEFKMRSVSKAEALEVYKNNEYKTELISNLEDGTITFCDHSNFFDLCRGGHIPNTGIIKAMKILSVAGAYWRGDEKNKQLTRVYGISFPKQKDLTDYLELLEEAKRRDHRKLGKELELFHFSQKVGQGLPLWLPKGAALRDRLEQFLKKAQKKALNYAKSHMNLKGFRQGQIPDALVKKQLSSKALFDMASEEVANEALAEGIKEHNIELVARPTLDVKEADDEKAVLVFTCTVLPEVTLGEYKGLDIKKADVEVTEEDV